MTSNTPTPATATPAPAEALAPPSPAAPVADTVDTPETAPCPVEVPTVDPAPATWTAWHRHRRGVWVKLGEAPDRAAAYGLFGDVGGDWYVTGTGADPNARPRRRA